MGTSNTRFGAVLDDLASRADEAFRAVQRRIFTDDDVGVNRNLVVETADAALVEDVATLVLITPWRLTGLIVPACGDGPRELLVAGGLRPVHRGDVAPLGVYWAVTLVPDMARLAGPRQARSLAASFAGPLRAGVRAWRTTPTPP